MFQEVGTNVAVGVLLDITKPRGNGSLDWDMTLSCSPRVVIGKKVFSHDEEAAEKIKTEIEAANPGVSDLDVHYDPQSGTVGLSGQAASAEAM